MIGRPPSQGVGFHDFEFEFEKSRDARVSRDRRRHRASPIESNDARAEVAATEDVNECFGRGFESVHLISEASEHTGGEPAVDLLTGLGVAGLILKDEKAAHGEALVDQQARYAARPRLGRIRIVL